jgi:WD40 repeat protein
MLDITELSLLVSCSLDRTIKLWDIRTGAVSENKTGHLKGVTNIAYSKGHKTLLSVGCEKDIYVWNPMCQHVVHRIQGHNNALCGIYAFDNSPEVISIDVSGKVIVWDVRNFKQVQQIKLTGESNEHDRINTFCYDEYRSQIVAATRGELFYLKYVQ